jgi:hypothetical protein
MATDLPVSFRASPLPSNFKGGPQQLQDAIVARLALQTQDQLALFVNGAVAPTSDSGPWVKNGITWYVWDTGTGAYVPQVIEFQSLKYVAQQAAPDQNKYTFWIETNGAGKAISLNYYSGGAWKSVYEDTFTATNAAIAAATQKYPSMAYLSAPQTIAIDTTLYKVLFDTAAINEGSAFDAANSKYICQTNGIFRVTANLQVDNNGGTASAMELGIRITVNGVSTAATPTSGAAVASPPGDRWYPSVSGIVAGAAGNELEVYLSASDGVNTADVNIAPQSQFFIEMVQAT